MAEDVLISDSSTSLTKSKKKKSERTKLVKDVEEIPLAPQSDATRKTKARFDQLLKQAVDQGNSDVKVGKKKKKPKDSDDVLEKLKKGEGLVKDEDAAILANTYVPGDSPKNEKSNKKRDKTLEGTENLAYEDETTFSTRNSKRLQKKKEKNDSDRTMSISDLAPPVVTSSSSETQKKVKKKKKEANSEAVYPEEKEVVSPGEEKKVKKKKKRIPETLSPEETESVTSPVVSPTATPRKKGHAKKVLSETGVTGEEAVPHDVQRKKKREGKEEDRSASVDDLTAEAPVKVKRKKKTKPSPSPPQVDGESIESPRSALSLTGDEADTAQIVDETTKIKKKRKKKKEEEPADEFAEAEAVPDVEDDGRILAVTIHRTDKLKNDFYILHPLVRVHVVNEKTGNYLRKQHSDRPVTSFYENNQDNLGYIQPIITQPYDFKEKRSTLPMWEELLVFNENFNYFIQQDPKVIIFFELLDFVSMNTASRQYDQAKTQGGWHRIAWAFLKVVGSNDKLNAGSKVRLQLYHPPERFRLDSGQVELYQWWETATRRPYPSTLYVTLKGITPPSTVQPSMRSLYATQEEVGKMTYQDLKKSLHVTGSTRRDHTQKKYMTTWARLAGQACKIPNSLLLSLHGGTKGCFVIKFSHNGRSLACACQDRDGYPILLYEIPSGELLARLSGHFGIIYDLCWSNMDSHLLSASSDGTARLWDLQDLSKVSEQLLPHPAFVYTAQFHPRVPSVIVTGGYDQVIRVWGTSPNKTNPELLQEIEGHRGNVNSLCFNDDGSKLYTADSLGSIKIWNVYVSEEPSRRGFIRDWGLYQEIQETELMGTPINYLKMHPSGRRLLVHSRDNMIRMIDLRILRIMQKYIGALNFREEIHSTISPCGTFVLAGSEDGSAYVWNTETGDQVACYSELNYRHPVTSLDYHPRDHMIAFCSLGDNQAVFVYNYNPQVAAIGAGIPVKPKESLSATKAGEVSSTVISKDDFEASETARLEKVMKKLASVSLSSQPMILAELHPLGIQEPSPRTMRTGLLGSSWGYDQTSSYITSRSMSPPPQMFSPHAPHSLGSTVQQQQMASQDLYFKQADGGWRPGFSSVGRHGARSSSPTLWGKPPTMSMSASQGKAQFSFQAPLGKSGKVRKVVALYDYKGQRSDELTFLQGDIIKVLYKDNENWWMGELRDGQQGFFPANYVAEDDVTTDDLADDVSQDGKQSEEDKQKKKVTAVKTRTGELKFMSATEDSEDDHLTPKKRTRRKKKAGESGSDISMKEKSSGSKTQLRAHFQEEESYA
ncbi:jouberin-like [Liolophura sinensis]|uniref:jouberin-like n=1 Tax=Liolophura sinensis TaxID=3198878 RepID=UPI00315945DE